METAARLQSHLASSNQKRVFGVMTCSKNEIIEIGRGIATDLDETPDPEGRCSSHAMEISHA